MSSALNQLIAQQQGPNVFGSAMQGLAAAGQQKQQATENQFAQQRISAGQRQLAMADQEYADKRKTAASQKIANVALAVNRSKNPEEQNAIYQQALRAAASQGDDVSQYPQQLDDNAKAILNYHYNQVYGGQLLEAELSKKPQGPVNVSAGSTLIDPSTGKVIFQAPEKGLSEYEKRSLNLRERELSGKGSENKPPAGYRWAENGVDLLAIKGGPADKQQGGKPLPVSLQKLEGEDIEAIQTANTIQADLGAIKSQIDSGQLDLGPVKNFFNSAKNAAGMSSEESRKFSTLQASLEKLRNDSLRLNKGVQTDGDAQRAWNELVKNINDPKLVSERLAEIQKINERGAALRAQSINLRRQNNNVPLIEDFSQFEVSPAIGQANSNTTNSAMSAEDQAAMEWANANPNDPRAAQIKQLHGVK